MKAAQFRHVVVLLAIVSAGAMMLNSLRSSMAQQPEPSPIYVISDLHFGVGMAGGKEWHPMEDFRWPRAFAGFVDKIRMQHPGGVQLVIAGDFLEQWQHPNISCKHNDVECGCNVDQMRAITADIIKAHRLEFDSFSRFLSNPSNNVIVLPGNHDAALTNDVIWAMVNEAVGPGRDRFLRIHDGLMITDDGRIAIEHGHQHGYDVNSFPNWPEGAVKECGNERRFFRGWGENFVQSLYNDVESKFPLIDNMVPDSEGKALYERYSEEKQATLADVIRFLEFNLLQTSFYQKIQGLSLEKPGERLSAKDVGVCRLCLQEDLLLLGNPRAEALLRRTGSDEKTYREALRRRVSAMPEDQVRTLCERAILLNRGNLSLGERRSENPMCTRTLATGVRSVLDPDGSGVLRSRVTELYERSKRRLSHYVFGHTHEARLPMRVEMPDGLNIAAINTGAFQRLMNREHFESQRKSGESDSALLGRLTHNDLKACYSVVSIEYKGRRAEASVKQWYMDEADEKGLFIDDACDVRCSAPPANCARGAR